MNKKIKYAILGLILAVLILIIINFQLHMPLQREIIKPPPAILKLDGKQQISGIGSYCWMKPGNLFVLIMQAYRQLVSH